MARNILSLYDIRSCIKPIAEKYHIREVYVFGSYARNEAVAESDIDLVVCGGEGFKPTSIFAFAEELRQLTNKDIDVYEISE